MALFIITCLAFAAANVLAESKGNRILVLVTKIGASSTFLLLGVLSFILEPPSGSTRYAIFVIAALAFSWLGDVLLVSRSKTALLSGIAAFLIAHIGFSAAFLSLRLNSWPFAAALGIWSVIGISLLRWLWGHLDKQYRVAVIVYSVAIILMVSLAVATLSPLLASAACMFAISDMSVARDRFIDRSISNKVWGTPLYYLAQLLFAVSVGMSAN